MNILAAGPESAGWRALRTGPSIEQAGVDANRLLELILSDARYPGSVKTALQNKKRLLDTEEVYYLISRSQTERYDPIRAKINASLRKHKDQAAVCEACRSAIQARKAQQT